MIEVETEYHISSSDFDEKPAYKCQGTCFKVWWAHDIDSGPFGVQLRCPMCNGPLSAARENVDYKITKLQPGVKLIPDLNAKTSHVSRLLDQFIPLREKHGWR